MKRHSTEYIELKELESTELESSEILFENIHFQNIHRKRRSNIGGAQIDLEDAESGRLIPAGQQRKSKQEAENLTDAITPQEDNPRTLAFTFRSVAIGCIWATFIAGSNVLFSFRTNWFTVPVFVVILTAKDWTCTTAFLSDGRLFSLRSSKRLQNIWH